MNSVPGLGMSWVGTPVDIGVPLSRAKGSGKPTVSYSQLFAFETCPRQFWYRHLEAYTPETPTRRSALGEVVHKATAAFFRDVTVDLRTLTRDLVARYAFAIAPNYAEALRLVLRAVDGFAPMPKAKRVVEQLLEADFGDVRLVYKPDVLEIGGNWLRITDWKIGEQIRPRDWLQLDLFAAAAVQQQGERYRALVQGGKLASVTGEWPERESTDFRRCRALEWMRETLKHLLTAREQGEKGFPATPGRGCPTCPLAAECEALHAPPVRRPEGSGVVA